MRSRDEFDEFDEFYVGYAETVPPSLVRSVRRRVVGWLAVGVAVAGLLAAGQERLYEKVFEWDTSRRFEGTLSWSPAPTLLVPTPDGGVRRFWLVAPKKFGLASDTRSFDGQPVELQGHLLYRGDRTMIEVTSPVRALGASAPLVGGGAVSLGHAVLEGEIVDSKCFLGAMNPGRSKVHRACAVRCISGGIPAALWTHGPAFDEVILLVDEEGRTVGDRVLDLVAEPVQIEGELWRYDDLLVLRSDPTSYRRIPMGSGRR